MAANADAVISLDELKDHLFIERDRVDLDPVLTTARGAAIEQVERKLGGPIVEQVVKFEVAGPVDGEPIILPWADIVRITEIQFYQPSQGIEVYQGVAPSGRIAAADVGRIEKLGEPPTLALLYAPGNDWPDYINESPPTNFRFSAVRDLYPLAVDETMPAEIKAGVALAARRIFEGDDASAAAYSKNLEDDGE